MIRGIPYFGVDTQEISKKILSSDIDLEMNVDSLYELVNNNINKKVVAVVDNKWLTWIDDITFDYKNKTCYIPYYTYELYKVEDKIRKRNDNGHLIIEDETLYIRHRYNYKKLEIDIEYLSTKGLILYNIEENCKSLVKTDKWINEDQFDINKLYELYVVSSFKEDDFILNKHVGGYHYIDRSPRQFKNKERTLRELFGLLDYSNETYYMKNKDYRDVREYKYEEVISKHGLINTLELYKIRRLRFESYLYCIMRSRLISDNEQFNEQFIQLGKTKEYIKYGKGIKLIIKNYWLDDNFLPDNQKTWSRE